jgi:Ala-tRNA(Pro) deacylase
MRIAAFLEDQRVAYESLPHAPAFSAQKRAKYLHVPGRQVAKSVLLRGPDGLLLAVLPANLHLDPYLLSVALGGPVRLANDAETAAIFADCEWGVVPPFGSLYGLPTVLDRSLDPRAMIVFEGQTHGQAVRMRCADFERLERPRRLRFAAPHA